MVTEEQIKEIEVVFALPGRCWRQTVSLPLQADAQAAVLASGLDRVCLAQTGGWPAALGVYGRKVDKNHILSHGQRLELYRPLLVDPRERRRQRVKK